jgi:hypothetical protein
VVLHEPNEFIQIKSPLSRWTWAGLIWLIIESDAQNTSRDLRHQQIPTKSAKEGVSWIAFAKADLNQVQNSQRLL